MSLSNDAKWPGSIEALKKLHDMQQKLFRYDSVQQPSSTHTETIARTSKPANNPG
jgi:hypothetical protein